MRYSPFLHICLCLATISLLIMTIGITGCTTRQPSGENEEIQEIRPFKKLINLSGSSITYYTKDSELFASQTSFVQENDDPFVVVDYGPGEELPVEVRKPTIFVLFSQPVVPLAKLGEVMTESDVLSISPAIEGIYRWYGSRLLSFEPTGKFMPQREYNVTVSKNTRSLGGKTLTGTTGFQFHTEYLHIVDFYPGSPYDGYSLFDVPLSEAKKITISFSHPVNLHEITKYIRVTSKGRSYSYTLSRPGDSEELNKDYIQRTIVVSIQQDFEENADVIVTLTKGARSEPENIGRPDEIQKTFHTLTPFMYRDYYMYSYSFPRSEKEDANPVYLIFSHPVDRESALQAISVSPDVENLEESLDTRGNEIKLSNLPVTYGGTYTIRISKDLKDIYGRELGIDYPVKIKVDDASIYYYFPNYGTRILESAFEPRIIYEHQNIFEGLWRVDTIKDPYETFSPQTLTSYDFSYAQKNIKHYRILDLSPWLNEEKKGAVGISWNFAQKNKDGVYPTWAQYNLQVQVTDLGITTRYGYNKIIVMVASLSSGKPVKNARVTLGTTTSSYLYDYTDGRGMVVFTLKEGEYARYFTSEKRIIQPRITAEYGNDRVIFIPNSSHNQYHFGIYNTATINHVEDETMKVFLFTDRGLYKPGERITFSGIDRNMKLGQFSIYEGPYEITVRQDYWDSEPFYSTTGMTTGQGTFTGTFDLPESLEPGYYTINYTRNDQQSQTQFQVAHFRRLAFGVTLKKPDIEYFSGDTVSLKVQADYLAGGALSNGDYEYYWTKQLTFYTPPGKEWEEYRFGPRAYEGSVHVSSGTGKLSYNGQGDISQKTSSETRGGTYSYECEVRVTDIDRQMIASRDSILVHPGALYIGTKIDSGTKGYWSYFVPRGKKMKVNYVLVSPDGKEFTPYPDQKMSARMYHVEWKVTVQKGVAGRMNQSYEEVEELEDEQDVVITNSKGTIEFTPRNCGSYYIECISADKKNREAVTRLYFYSTGSTWVYWGFDNPSDIKLVPDRELYEPGEKARILVQSPVPEGTYLLTIEREGILDEKIISLTGSANVIDIEVKKEYMPIFFIALSTYSGRTDDPPDSYFEPDLGKPKGYFGITSIQVSNEIKRIDVEIIPGQKVYKPGSKGSVLLKATHNGKPVAGAEITFLAADRGVLDLINYHVPDPLSEFYSANNFPLGTSGADSRTLLMDPVTYDVKDLPGGGGKGSMEETEGDEGKKDSELSMRRDFRALAVFKTGLMTDTKGTATCDFVLPDTLTTYRMTAVAVYNDEFGREEDELMVQNPINVRTALNRRLRVRDTSFAGVVMTNLDNNSHNVIVTIDSDIIKIDDNKEKAITIPPNSSMEVPFTLQAVMAGKARITFTIMTDILREQLEETIIIEKPLIKETFTITGKTGSSPEKDEYDRIDEGIIIPSSIAPGYGGLSLALDSTRLASLKDSINYLFDYPYGCVEQQLSRLIPLILFGDKTGAFGLSSEVIHVKETIQETFKTIFRFQGSDGGVPFWMENGYASSPYCSIKLAHAVYLAQQKGYDINRPEIENLLGYISTLSPPKHSPYLEYYGLYVRSLFGKNVGIRSEILFNENTDKSHTAYGFLGLIFINSKNNQRARECLIKIKNYMKVNTRTIDLVNTSEDNYYFDSDIQKLALFLLLYEQTEPGNELIEKITYTLMKRQKYGYWGNTSDTTWALLALVHLLKGEAGGKTDFAAKVFINNTTIVEKTFRGISKESYFTSFPFKETPLSGFSRDTQLPLSFEKQGTGNLYYSASLTYALPTEVIRGRDEGFSLFSEIIDRDGKTLLPENLELSKTYRMRVVISSSKQRNFVILRVPIPSGGEILDASFVTTGLFNEQNGIDTHTFTGENAYGDEYEYSYIWGGPRKVIMDNEVHYFFDDFFRGKQEVEFLFRLTTPGIYPTPPVYAECMYEEEVFGRTDGEIFIIRE